MSQLEIARGTRNKYMRRAAVTSVVMRGVSTVALLGLTPILTRELGVEAYGVLVTLTSAAGVLGLADLGIASGLVSKIASQGWATASTRSLLSAAAVLLATASTLAVCVGAVLSWALPWPRWLNAPHLPSGELRWATLFALVGVGLSLTCGLGQKIDLARQRGHAVAVWGAASALAGPAGAVLVGIFTSRLSLVVAASALLPPLVLAAQTTVTIRSLPSEMRPARRFATRADMFDSLRTGAVFLALGLVGTVSYNIDTLIVANVLGASAAAVFSVVIRAFGLVGSMIQGSLAQLWSAFAEALARNDIAWVRTTLFRATLIVTGVTSVVSAGLVLIGQRLIGVWLGSDLRPTVGLLIAGAMWTTYLAAVFPLAMFLNGAQLQRAQLVATVPMAALNLCLSIVLTRDIGTPGPLIGSLVAHLVCVAGPLTVVAYRRIHCREPLPGS